MGPKILLAGLIIMSVCGVSAQAVSASTPRPTVTSVSPTAGTVGTEVTIMGTNLAGVTKVKFDSTTATVLSDNRTRIKTDVPVGAATGYIKVKTRGGKAKSHSTFTVLNSSSTTTTPASPSIEVGNANSDSAMVSGDATNGSPTGTVAFYDCGPTPNPEPCTSQANEVGSPVGVTTGANDTSTASSVSFTPSSAGYWCFAGHYSGDSNYATSSDTTTDECFDVTSGTTPSSTATTPASTSIGLGNANSDSAVISGDANYGSPTGTVAFYDCGPTPTPEPCTSQANEVGSPVGLTAGANNTSTASSPSLELTSTGYWCFAGYYFGDASYAASSDTSTDECFDVMAASSTTMTPASTLIGLGNANSDSAVISGDAKYGSPTGTVTFYDCGPTPNPEPCTSQANQVGSPVGLTAGANDTSTAASTSFTPSAIGYWCFAAYYSGDSNFAASSDISADACFAVSTPLDDAVSVVSAGSGEQDYCALLGSSGVDCWGASESGQLGNGSFDGGSDTPVTVEGVGGAGSLTGVTSLVGNDAGASYCALLTSGGVDCWGYDYYGQLGNGTFDTTGNQGSSTPVAVDGVGGSGTLTGVTQLVSGAGASYCAILTSGGVDCWGYDYSGQLGNGTFDTTGSEGSATPVEVEGVGGTGTLSGVTHLVGGDFDPYADSGYCAVLASGGVDCWGFGHDGQLGNGTFYTTGDEGSATPVPVEGVGGAGTLTGVTSLAADGGVGYCALLTSGGVDCWGLGDYGQLGDGSFYESSDTSGSATPVEVEGVGGTGTITGVTSLVGEGSGGGGSYCAVLASGGADCWGLGVSGQLGNGSFYPSQPFGSATPVAVEGVGGTGTLAEVTSLVGTASGSDGFCALTSGGVDCWGTGTSGELGNGTFNNADTPVVVEGAGGTGILTGVMSLVNDQDGDCALLTSSRVDCWGDGGTGQLGNGSYNNADTPVAVVII